MSKEKHNDARANVEPAATLSPYVWKRMDGGGLWPVSAELGAKVDAVVQTVQEMAQEKPTSVNAYGLSTWTKAKKLITDLVKSYSAPVAAQPDVTQQTLDDVMAGIPARDAEIEALRREMETLQAQHTATLSNIEAFVACDASAISYLSLGEYRTALLKMLRQAPAITSEKE